MGTTHQREGTVLNDASTTNGLAFRISTRRTTLFGLLDSPPALVGESMQRGHLNNRLPWPRGQVGRQVSWSHHGAVRIIEMPGGRQLAIWTDEAVPA